jgi:thiol:disulfide interchange protein DsbA
MLCSPRRRQVLLALCATPALAVAQTVEGTPEAGTDYVVLPHPQPPLERSDKIEVLDFFGYWCPHCFQFITDLDPWRKHLAADVAYRHVPVAFRPNETPLALTFYALQAMNRLEDMHVKVFAAIHVDKRRMVDADSIADFMASSGIDRAKWLSVYNSFSVVTAANRAPQIWQAYGIDGTPTLACDGRFMTSPSMVRSKSNVGALATMDYLIDRVRRERSKNKK